MSINNRVEQIIKKTTTSKSAFSKTTGISTVILSHISSGRNKVSVTAVEQILIAYPKVNAEWLLLGKGQMFKDGIETETTDMLAYQIQQLGEELDRYHKSANGKLTKLLSTLEDLKA
ncbi:MAG: hypothetical protein QMC70_08365 [Bacteroidia bacterium]|jgi:hypothetical protein|tara:strand:+ start:232 stop:582 length:351 start_codon:yes stop_codon:yes gene_type:complete